MVELIAHAEEQGPVTGLVNSARCLCAGSLEQVDLELWHRLVAVNATSVLIACRGDGASHVAARSYGRIVNVASTTGVVGIPGAIAYAMTKGAVVSLTKCLGVELARKGVTVNAVAPGMFRTEMTDVFRASEESERWCSSRCRCADGATRPSSRRWSRSWSRRMPASSRARSSAWTVGGPRDRR